MIGAFASAGRLAPKFVDRSKAIVPYVAGKIGKKPMSYGGKALSALGVGAGLFTVYDIIASLLGGEGQPEAFAEGTTESRTSRYEQTLQDILEPSLSEELERSSFLENLAGAQQRTGFEDAPEISSDLRALLQGAEMDKVFKSRQKVNPSLREAYARAGLLP